MTAIWTTSESGWGLLSPKGFPDEATLHDLVEEAPHLLPLAGSPDLVVLGREVRLGSGYADLIAVEPSGRLAVVETKLASNAEARRAVVSQVLAYAAYLHGLSLELLEGDVLGNKLQQRGYDTVAGAVAAHDQVGALDREEFERSLADNLAAGAFRLVFVLDDAPEELVRLVGYLEVVAGEVVIDLVTVALYDVGGSRVLVPQRVEPEKQTPAATTSKSRPETKGYLAEGGDDFAAAIPAAKESDQPRLRRLHDWAVALEAEGLVRLGTYHGILDRMTLLPRLKVDDAGLVTIWNDSGGASLQFWRSVFERRAPSTLPKVEDYLAPATVGQGNTTREIPDELLQLLTEAYREAAASQR